MRISAFINRTNGNSYPTVRFAFNASEMKRLTGHEKPPLDNSLKAKIICDGSQTTIEFGKFGSGGWPSPRA